MCDTEGSDPEPNASASDNDGVISLCVHRRRRDIEEGTEALIAKLEAIHRRAIEVHNRIISRAQLSVLTELCRTAGLFLDLIDEELQAAVVTPAALYGDSGGNIFGKKPLQKRILRAVDDPLATELLQSLNSAHPAVWEYYPRSENPTGLVYPLAGPARGEPREVAGVVVRAGQLGNTPGVYSGWPLTHRGEDYVVFGHRLERSREVAVRDLLSTRADRDEPEIWQRVELALLRAIIDPGDRHQRREAKCGYDPVRRPISRNGLLLAIRRGLWRHFAEPCDGLTIHAHIAALVDDDEGQRAFVEEVCEITELMTLKSGGLAAGDPPVNIAEVLEPFFIDGRGNLICRGELRGHPLALLLLGDVEVDAMGLELDRPIDEALRWAESHGDHRAARRVKLAWMTYRTEQNLMATYGWCAGRGRWHDDQEPSSDFSFARRSPVLPNIRVLFDARILSYCLADLKLDNADRSRLERGLLEAGLKLESYRLSDIECDERSLSRLRGVSHSTCNAVRRALLDLATHWRWWRCGFDPRAADDSTSSLSGSEDDELSAR